MNRRERNMRAQGIAECEDCGRLCELPSPESGLIWLGWCMPCAFDLHSREEKSTRARAAIEQNRLTPTVRFTISRG